MNAIKIISVALLIALLVGTAVVLSLQEVKAMPGNIANDCAGRWVQKRVCGENGCSTVTEWVCYAAQ